MPEKTDPQKRRMEFVLLFDVENGNPNGDPDAGNIPRVDPEDNRGLVTDVCLKRKVRNYAELRGQNIYIRDRSVLQERRAEVEGIANLDEKGKRLDKKAGEGAKAGAKDAKADIAENRKLVCAHYYDVRTFGAVMSTKQYNAGQVRGPVQMTFAKSIDPVHPLDHTVSRVAVEAEADEKKGSTFGRKSIIPYGLYRCSGFISPAFAEATGFDADDLALFWEALENMFEHDRSAARGLMVARRLIVFRHEDRLGNAPAHKLLEMVKVQRKGESEKGKPLPPRAFADYEVEVDDKMPKGVTMEEKF